jgi:hypothetical protein
VTERLVDASASLVGPAAIIDGRAALILSQLLARSMRQGLSVRQIVAEARLSSADQAAALRAELALEDAGERWRIAQRKPSGNSATPGNDAALPSEAMSVTAAARVIGRTDRRVRQLIKAGDLSAVLTPRGYMLDRREVVSYRCRRDGADVDLPPLVALPEAS